MVFGCFMGRIFAVMLNQKSRKREVLVVFFEVMKIMINKRRHLVHLFGKTGHEGVEEKHDSQQIN